MAGLLLPEALAYSSIARLPPQAGVVALLCGLLAYALLGRSRFAIVAATSSSAALTAATTAALAGAQPGASVALAAGLVLLTGVALLLASVAQLGAVASFIAKPVLRGFAFGLALTITVHQIGRGLGLPAHAHSVLFEAVELASRWQEWNPLALVLGVLAWLALRSLRRWPRVPGALAVLAVAVGLTWGLSMAPLPLAWQLARVGAVQLVLPSPAWPDLARAEWLRLGETAFALMLLLFAESNAAIRGSALRHGDSVDANRDLLALGVGNLLSGLLQGLPVGAGFSATAANETARPRSRMAGALAAALVLLALAVALPLIAWIPECVLAAVVIHAVGRNLHPAGLRRYFEWRRDRVVVLASLAAVLLLGVLDGLLIGVGASLLLALRDFSRSQVTELVRLHGGHAFVDRATQPDGLPEPGLLLLRLEAPLFFASVDGMALEVQRWAGRHPGAHTVILSLEETPDLDSSAMEGLRDLAAQLARHGQRLQLARLREPAIEVLRQARLPGLDALAISAPSVDDAVHAAHAVHAARPDPAAPVPAPAA